MQNGLSIYFCFEIQSRNWEKNLRMHLATESYWWTRVEVTVFDRMKEDDLDSSDFGEMYTLILINQSGGNEYVLQEGFLFKGPGLSIPCTSLLEFLVLELHTGGVAHHFAWDKKIALVEDPFFLPRL